MNDLINLMQYAKIHSPYYSKIIPDIIDENAIQKIPVLKKSVVELEKMKILSDVSHNAMFNTLKLNVTSGTSGKPLEIYWNHDDLLNSHLKLWRMRKNFYSILPKFRFCSLYSISYYGKRVNKAQAIIRKNSNEVAFCKLFQDEEHMKLYYDMIMSFKPEWLFFQPSFTLNLIDYITKNDFKVPNFIRYIELTSEPLTKTAQKYISEYFNCVVKNMYGCMELNGIAYECPSGNLHILDDNVFIETDDEGNVLATSLCNYTFPMIRYELGDSIKICRDYKCSCGLMGNIVKKIYGRTNQEVGLKDGTKLKEATISYCVDRAEAVIGIGIIQYKAILLKDERLLIKLVRKNSDLFWQEQFEKILRESFNMFYPSLEIACEFVEAITYKEETIKSKFSVLDIELKD